jgi:isocitrate dehydrogenase kinase/phosphatase
MASMKFRLPCPSCICQGGDKLAIDAALHSEDDLHVLFSFARAYFMVDMEIPSRLRAVFAQHDAAQAAQ